MPGTRPTKKELAEMKVANELGVTPTAIARQMGKSHHTVIKYLQSDVYTDPGITKLVDTIRKNETNDLYVLSNRLCWNVRSTRAMVGIIWDLPSSSSS